MIPLRRAMVHSEFRECNNPDCEERSKRIIRGLCGKCYDRFSYMVHEGVTTWDELTASGIALKSRQAGKFKQSEYRKKQIAAVAVRAENMKSFVCIHPGCESTEHKARGLCDKHYNFRKKQVVSGKLSWKYLIESGLACDVCDGSASAATISRQERNRDDKVE